MMKENSTSILAVRATIAYLIWHGMGSIPLLTGMIEPEIPIPTEVIAIWTIFTVAIIALLSILQHTFRSANNYYRAGTAGVMFLAGCVQYIYSPPMAVISFLWAYGIVGIGFYGKMILVGVASVTAMMLIPQANSIWWAYIFLGGAALETYVISHLRTLLYKFDEKTREYRRMSSELHSYTAEMTRMDTEIAIKDKQITQLMRFLSHKLRTPLNAIVSFNYILGNSGHVSDQGKPMLEHIDNASRQMTVIINKFMEDSALFVGHTQMSVNRVSLSELLEDKIRVARRTEALKFGGLIHIEDFIKSSVYVWGDELRLGDVFSRVISHFMAHAEQRISITLRPANDNALVIISDTSEGALRGGLVLGTFLEKDEGYVSTQRDELSVPQQIITLHGGRMFVDESDSTLGSSLVISIPLLEIARTEETPREWRDSSIWVCDDDSSLADIYVAVLADSSNVTHFVSGEDMLADLRARTTPYPDLILLDIHMEQISGDDVLEVLKAQEETSRIPIVVVSGDTSRLNKIRMRYPGVRTMRKPVYPAQLKRVIMSEIALPDEMYELVVFDDDPTFLAEAQQAFRGSRFKINTFTEYGQLTHYLKSRPTPRIDGMIIDMINPSVGDGIRWHQMIQSHFPTGMPPSLFVSRIELQDQNDSAYINSQPNAVFRQKDVQIWPYAYGWFVEKMCKSK